MLVIMTQVRRDGLSHSPLGRRGDVSKAVGTALKVHIQKVNLKRVELPVRHGAAQVEVVGKERVGVVGHLSTFNIFLFRQACGRPPTRFCHKMMQNVTTSFVPLNAVDSNVLQPKGNLSLRTPERNLLEPSHATRCHVILLWPLRALQTVATHDWLLVTLPVLRLKLIVPPRGVELQRQPQFVRECRQTIRKKPR